MSLTDAEQFLIELINRARLDPSAEAARYGTALNSGLSSGTISTSAKQVLAPNELLHDAASAHSNWMLSTNTFGHAGVGNSDPGDRMEDAGYRFSGTSSWRENLAWSGSTGSVNLEQAISAHHRGLYESKGHRVNTFAENIREIGVAQEYGKFTYNGTTFNASMLTEKFALSGSSKFVTGVAYRDSNNNDFYSIGEGLSGYWVREGSVTERTASAGGYALDVGSGSTATVKVGSGSTVLATVNLDMSDGNAKLDVVKATNGNTTLGFSVSAELVSGIGRLELLGSANLSLKANDKANVLHGNSGHNLIKGKAGTDHIYGEAGSDTVRGGSHDDRVYGGGGNDKLYGDGASDVVVGANGHDKLYGNNGHDRLFGGSGADKMYAGRNHDKLFGGDGSDWLDGGLHNDVLRGGAGNDRFVFNGGKDYIQDFKDNVDTLVINAAAIGQKGLTKGQVVKLANVEKGRLVVEFDSDTRIILNNFNDASDLFNDLIIV